MSVHAHADHYFEPPKKRVMLYKQTNMHADHLANWSAPLFWFQEGQLRCSHPGKLHHYYKHVQQLGEILKSWTKIFQASTPLYSEA